MNRKPSSSFFRLDEQVFFTMGGLCVLALLIMAFRIGTHTACAPVTIAVKTVDPVERVQVRFNAESAKLGSSYAWNFGDGTVKEEATAFTSHEYKTAGKYTVTVTVNGECTDVQVLAVREAPVVVNTGLQPIIICNVTDTAYTNEPISFSDGSTAGTAWEWKFGETGTVDATGKSVAYSFRYSGRKFITLKINNKDLLTTSYSLFVLDKEEERRKKLKQQEDGRIKTTPRPPIIIQKDPDIDPIKPKEDAKVETKPKPVAVTNEQLDALIRGVCDNNKTIADFHPYMCGSSSIPVVYNSDLITLEKMCEEIKGIKSKNIKTLKITPTITDNCLSAINVTLKEKGWFGKHIKL